MKKHLKQIQSFQFNLKQITMAVVHLKFIPCMKEHHLVLLIINQKLNFNNKINNKLIKVLVKANLILKEVGNLKIRTHLCKILAIKRTNKCTQITQGKRCLIQLDPKQHQLQIITYLEEPINNKVLKEVYHLSQVLVC